METSAQKQTSQTGLTLLEVMVALVIVSTTALPLLISLGDAHRRVTRANIKRQMKQLLKYKLSHVLLDRPAEDQEPIYVDGMEGNFGEDFEQMDADEKRYFFDDSLYNYSYRIDSQEIDLGTTGGITGEEEGDDESNFREPDPGGTPGLGAEGEQQQEEELGQLRYIVTLTVFFRNGNANFDQAMSIVTYVKHPHESEAMSGPDLGPGGGGQGGPGIGSGEAGVGASQANPNSPNGPTNSLTGSSSGAGSVFGR